jgi:hypothetical protein
MGDASIACIDGHVAWIKLDKWEQWLGTMPGPLWFAPDLEDGAPDWWEYP